MPGLEGRGYGNRYKTKEECKERYKGLTDALLHSPFIMDFCYTQFTDVEQKKKDPYTYERKTKFDMEFFHAVNYAKQKSKNKR